MLRRVDLFNFKCFEKLELRCEAINLLCGLNGMGKSSLLQALLVLRQSIETGELSRGRLVLGGERADLGTGSDVLFDGAVTKPISDLYVSEVTVDRYRCCDCCRTFRHYPQGVDRRDQSHRLSGLAALSWALGLSFRSVSHLLGAMGCDLSRMSVWRDVQQSGSNALGGWLNRHRGRVRLMGADETVLDETVLKVRGRQTVVELSEKWRSLTCHQRVRGMPQTNNCTERTIGRSKIRYKTTRGYKSEAGMMNGLGLTQWVWSGQEGLDLGDLVAV